MLGDSGLPFRLSRLRQKDKRVGCPWRDMHERYGKWNSVYVRFRRWAEQGVWDALLETLVDLGLTDDWQHHCPRAQPSRRRERGTHKEGFGRSRGGFTSKIHARADGQGCSLGFKLTGGEVSDYQAVEDLMALPTATPPRSNRSQPIACNFRRYKDRNRIERMFNRLKQFRRIATRYDKPAKSFLGFLHLAAAKLWLAAFVNRS